MSPLPALGGVLLLLQLAAAQDYPRQYAADEFAGSEYQTAYAQEQQYQLQKLAADQQQYYEQYQQPAQEYQQYQQQQKRVDKRYSVYQEPQQQEEEADYPPQPFSYEYGGADKDGRHFAKTETKDEEGVVQGEYRVELPDGRVQIVSYRADPVLGYQANVRYEGEARPEPVYEETEEEQQRKRFVPNYNYKPYARQY